MRLAARGLRDMDAGPQPIDDPAQLADVRRQARRVYVESATAAALLALLFTVAPSCSPGKQVR